MHVHVQPAGEPREMFPGFGRFEDLRQQGTQRLHLSAAEQQLLRRLTVFSLSNC